MNKTIAIFDSGAGGLNILSACIKQNPKIKYIYCRDNLNFPYGNKTEEEVLNAVLSFSKKVAKEHKLAALVIACNTASTIVLPELREIFSFPIFGVVPGIKPAAKLTKSGIIALLATSATVKRSYIDNLYKEFADGTTLLKVGSDKLVTYVENFFLNDNQKENLSLIKGEINEIANSSADVVVLGCTHFGLILDQLKQVAPNVKNWVDPSESVVSHVFSSLGIDASTEKDLTPQLIWLESKESKDLCSLQKKFMQLSVFI